MQKKSKRKMILEAATNVFAEKGFHQAKMDEIALRAKVAKGTLYYNYSSKSKLFAATVTDGMNEIMEKISKELESELPFVDHFRLLVSLTIRLYLQHSEITRIYINELSSGIEPQTLNEIREARHRFIAFVTDIITTGQEKGYLKPINPSFSALSLLGIVDALCNEHLSSEHSAGKNDTGPDEMIETVFSILYTGLCQPDKIQ